MHQPQNMLCKNCTPFSIKKDFINTNFNQSIKYIYIYLFHGHICTYNN